MQLPDYIVLLVYFLTMAGIGFLTMRKVKRQEDYFIGGHGFGKVLQTFAAFGAGTGSGDPVAVSEKTFISGMSGMWAIMGWLAATPFYWITACWYRRMRHTTLGDWFVERYNSKGFGLVYALFGCCYYIFYSAFLLSAVGVFAEPLMGSHVRELMTQCFGGDFTNFDIQFVVVPVIAGVVILYGMLGGLIAAYWTDFLQGICIVVLSVLLIPFGLWALVEKFGDKASQGMLDGFQIMHDRLPESYFTLVGSSAGSEWPIYRIVVMAVLLLIGIIVVPHMIATGGGAAKKELDARIGMVTGNVLKRLCTVGWVLTALIILALMAGDVRLQSNPEQAWGFASLELFKNAPGLTGLMFACLIAALMSSVSCYMVVASGLIVRNVYATYLNKNASDARCLWMGRLAGLFVVLGSVLIALRVRNVYALFLLAAQIPILLSAIFLIGMYWRRATKGAAWLTFLSTLIIFFVLPWAPLWKTGFYEDQRFLGYTTGRVTCQQRVATEFDVEQRDALIENYDQLYEKKFRQALDKILRADRQKDLVQSHTHQEIEATIPNLPDRPARIVTGESFVSTNPTDPTQVKLKSVFWSGDLTTYLKKSDGTPVDKVKIANQKDLQKFLVANRGESDEKGNYVTTYRYRDDALLFKGSGQFRIELLPYYYCGVNLEAYSPAMLETFGLIPKVVLPFLLMIVLSFVTPRLPRQIVDRYFIKMKVPVLPDPEQDELILNDAYINPEKRKALEYRKLFPGSNWEMLKPSLLDVGGFVISFLLCCGVIALAVFVANFVP